MNFTHFFHNNSIKKGVRKLFSNHCSILECQFMDGSDHFLMKNIELIQVLIKQFVPTIMTSDLLCRRLFNQIRYSSMCCQFVFGK